MFLSLHRHCMLRHTLNSGYFCKIVSLSLLPSLKTFSYSNLTYFRISFSFYSRNSAAIYFRKFCLVILSPLGTRLFKVLFAGKGSTILRLFTFGISVAAATKLLFRLLRTRSFFSTLNSWMARLLSVL